MGSDLLLYSKSELYTERSCKPFSLQLLFAILLSQAEEMERPSDIDGLIYIPFKENVEEAKVSLAKEMRNNGYTIDIANL